MQEYIGLKSGHMEFLIKALDGNTSEVFAPPLTLPPLKTHVDPTLLASATEFLKRTGLLIKPRIWWPRGVGLPLYELTGKIGQEFEAQPGNALCNWGDAGWGELVRIGKYQDQHFSDDLVLASVRLIRDWNPQPAPAWVTNIPSLRHPELVKEFAQRLASALDLPFYPALEKTENRPEQKTMENGVQQARNVDGSLAIIETDLDPSSVLLVDDIVDSRWTFTVAAWLLRKSGAGKVFPLALAEA
jgi:ATP-dependent DNA helicase RecQ